MKGIASRAVFLVVAWLALSPLAGYAAVEIGKSLPDSGATIGELPAAIEVWAVEPTDPAFTQIIVVAPNGARIDDGDTQSDPKDPLHLLTGLASGGTAGQYVVHLLSGQPNTTNERSASFSFDLTADFGCEEEGLGQGCLDELPSVDPGEALTLPTGVTVSVDLSSNKAGPVDIAVFIESAAGEPIETARVWVRATHLEMDHGEFPHEAIAVERGRYQASYVGMGMSGNWRLAVDFQSAPDQPVQTVFVPVEMD